MSQNDLSIANQGFASFRSDLNSALQALGSTNSGTSAPSTTYANQLFYDTTNNILKIRNEDNDAFISLFTLDQTNDNIESLTINGAFACEGFTSNGIDDNADAIAITIDSDENIAIGVTSKNSSNNGSLTIGHTGMTKVSASASGNADELVLIGADASANVGMSIIANNANQSNIFFGDEDDTDIGGITYDHSDNGLKFTTNTSERMRIDSSGNVGIGTSSPSAALQVVGSFSNQIKFGTNTSVYTDLSMGTGFTIFDSVGGDSGAFDFRDDGTSRMRIDSSGNVGIGTSSPTFSSGGGLQVKGSAFTNVRVTSGGNTGIDFAQTTSGASYLFNRDNAELIFGTNNTERMRILSGGSVLINRSSSNTVTSTALDIDADEYVFGIVITANGTNGAFVRLLADDGTTVGSIDHSGSNARYLTSSDYRLKENIVDMTDATTRIKQLKPRRFNFIADETNTTVDGFIAHEVSGIVPEAVNGEKDAVDADGNIDPQGIDQSKLVPLLVKTIQELEARITALEGA